MRQFDEIKEQYLRWRKSWYAWAIEKQLYVVGQLIEAHTYVCDHRAAMQLEIEELESQLEAVRPLVHKWRSKPYRSEMSIRLSNELEAQLATTRNIINTDEGVAAVYSRNIELEANVEFMSGGIAHYERKVEELQAEVNQIDDIWIERYGKLELQLAAVRLLPDELLSGIENVDEFCCKPAIEHCVERIQAAIGEVEK